MAADLNSFGYEDGISQPAVQGVGDAAVPQAGTIRQGIVLCNRTGDEVSSECLRIFSVVARTMENSTLRISCT